MKNYPGIGIQVPEVLLPKQNIDYKKWAVIACDQFTSQPEYWSQVENNVGESPSTLHLILPENYLDKPDTTQRVLNIQQTMREYVAQGLLDTKEGMIYVERIMGGKTRKGLVLALDLEHYDYNKGAQTLIRATEGTIVERIPPRMKIRENALLELPHILVLIDDPARSVIEPIGKQKEMLPKLYDFDLMMNSGHVSGYLVNDESVEKQVIAALETLSNPENFANKYGLKSQQSVLLFAMGDGNHSLATAKATWEKLKPVVGMDHPVRYALVEIENIYDEGLEFAPIHRVLFNVKHDVFEAMQAYFGKDFSYHPQSSFDEMAKLVNSEKSRQIFGVFNEKGTGIIEITNPPSNLVVGSLQAWLDAFITSGGAEKIDYVHGDEVVHHLGTQPGNSGFYLPAMNKSDLFKTVILDGVLPRKAFSMGEAHEKRFYIEARQITP
jgi:hypothetical protein